LIKGRHITLSTRHQHTRAVFKRQKSPLFNARNMDLT